MRHDGNRQIAITAGGGLCAAEFDEGA